MKNCKRKLGIFGLLFGFCLCFFPAAKSAADHLQAASVLDTWKEEKKALNKKETEEVFEKARLWNETIQQIQQGLTASSISRQEYEQQLNLNEDGIMGILHIPALSLTLPVYHGSTPEVLSAGVGHLMESSLPCGSKSGRAVLSAHRGLPGQELFTRLDELRKGDRFWIENPIGNLWYEVCDIRVIEPTDLQALDIIENEDLVTLMTCTPYGINSHRLLVTGKRCASDLEEPQDGRVPGALILLIRLWPYLLAALLSFLLVLSRLRLKKKRNRKKC